MDIYLGNRNPNITGNKLRYFYNLYFKWESDELISLSDYDKFIDAMIDGSIKYTAIDGITYLVVQSSDTEVEVTEYPLDANNPIIKRPNEGLIIKNSIYSLINLEDGSSKEV